MAMERQKATDPAAELAERLAEVLVRERIVPRFVDARGRRTHSGQLSGSDRLAGSGEISPDTERIQARKTLRGKVFARRNSQAR